MRLLAFTIEASSDPYLGSRMAAVGHTSRKLMISNNSFRTGHNVAPPERLTPHSQSGLMRKNYLKPIT